MPLGGPSTIRFLKVMRPFDGISRPEMILSRVDFPQPDGPMMDRKDSFSIRQEKSSNTLSSRSFTQKDLARLFTSMIDGETMGSDIRFLDRFEDPASLIACAPNPSI